MGSNVFNFSASSVVRVRQHSRSLNRKVSVYGGNFLCPNFDNIAIALWDEIIRKREVGKDRERQWQKLKSKPGKQLPFSGYNNMREAKGLACVILQVKSNGAGCKRNSLGGPRADFSVGISCVGGTLDLGPRRPDINAGAVVGA